MKRLSLARVFIVLAIRLAHFRSTSAVCGFMANPPRIPRNTGCAVGSPERTRSWARFCDTKRTTQKRTGETAPPRRFVSLYSTGGSAGGGGIDERYIYSFLHNNNDDFNHHDYGGDDPSTSPASRYTHMIGVPMEECRDLLLELESVQRAVLYHCPLLLDACVLPVVTRMPLVYVDASSSSSSSLGANDNASAAAAAAGGSMMMMMMMNLDQMTNVTSTLHQIVSDVVNEFIYVKDDHSDETQEEQTRRVEMQSQSATGENSEGYKPLLMSFRGLEVDGRGNEILHAIGTECDGTTLLRKVVDEIRSRVTNECGWPTFLPQDEPQGTLERERRMVTKEGDLIWRPRVPFMRLPDNFEEMLPSMEEMENRMKENKMDYVNIVDEEEQKDEQDISDEGLRSVRSPEQGGNGISPIFWYRWWDDEFAKGDGVRLREIAVYSRTGPVSTNGHVTEKSFYVPNLRTPLPRGNDMLTKSEERDKAYNDARYDVMNRPDERAWRGSEEPNAMELQRLQKEAEIRKNREALERLYQSPPADETAGIQKGIDSSSTSSTRTSIPSGDEPVTRVEGDKYNTTSSALRDIASNRASIRATKPMTKKKDLPSIEDNPIFKNFRNKRTMAADHVPSQQKRVLPPFPSDEYFVGVWRLVSSPTGRSAEEEMNSDDDEDDATKSDNLILRVDGTTAGGPVLDSTHNHKAAGGTWRMFRARWVGRNKKNRLVGEEEEQEAEERTRLRIRLVIPPKKERILVMEGEVTRVLMPRGNVGDDAVFAPSTFSIPEVEAVLKSSEQASSSSAPEEGLLHCGGEAWVEDADGGGNRKKVGSFSLMKLKTLDPSRYRYTIPGSRTIQD